MEVAHHRPTERRSPERGSFTWVELSSRNRSEWRRECVLRQRLNVESDLHLEERALVRAPDLHGHVVVHAVRHGFLDHLAQGAAGIIAGFPGGGELKAIFI